MIRNTIDRGEGLKYYVRQEERPVYVCLCHGITENQIRTCIQGGARSLWDLQGQLGVATNCGSCAAHACDMLEAAHCAGGRERALEPAALLTSAGVMGASASAAAG